MAFSGSARKARSGKKTATDGHPLAGFENRLGRKPEGLADSKNNS